MPPLSAKAERVGFLPGADDRIANEAGTSRRAGGLLLIDGCESGAGADRVPADTYLSYEAIAGALVDPIACRAKRGRPG